MNTPDITVESVQSSGSTVSEGAVTITKPTGLAVGDLLVVTLVFGQNDTTPTPSGWTVIRNNSVDLGTDGDVAAFYKVADSGDVAASNFSFDVTDTTGNIAGSLYRISGYNSSNVVGNFDSGFDSTSGTSRSHTISLTPAQADSVLIALVVSDATNTFSSPSSTGSPTWTEVQDTQESGFPYAFWTGYASYDSVTEITNFSITTSSSTSRSDVLIFEIRTAVSSDTTPTFVTTGNTAFTPTGSAGASGTVGFAETVNTKFDPAGRGSTLASEDNIAKNTATGVDNVSK